MITTPSSISLSPDLRAEIATAFKSLNAASQAVMDVWRTQVEDLADTTISDAELVEGIKRMAHEEGNQSAMYVLGHLYQGQGIRLGARQMGIAEDPVQAFYWVNMRHTVNPHDLLAMRELGDFLCRGYGAPVDAGRGLKLIAESVFQAVMHELPAGKTPDEEVARLGMIGGVGLLQMRLDEVFPDAAPAPTPTAAPAP